MEAIENIDDTLQFVKKGHDEVQKRPETVSNKSTISHEMRIGSPEPITESLTRPRNDTSEDFSNKMGELEYKIVTEKAQFLSTIENLKQQLKEKDAQLSKYIQEQEAKRISREETQTTDEEFERRFSESEVTFQKIQFGSRVTSQKFNEMYEKEKFIRSAPALAKFKASLTELAEEEGEEDTPNPTVKTSTEKTLHPKVVWPNGIKRDIKPLNSGKAVQHSKTVVGMRRKVRAWQTDFSQNPELGNRSFRSTPNLAQKLNSLDDSSDSSDSFEVRRQLKKNPIIKPAIGNKYNEGNITIIEPKNVSFRNIQPLSKTDFNSRAQSEPNLASKKNSAIFRASRLGVNERFVNSAPALYKFQSSLHDLEEKDEEDKYSDANTNDILQQNKSSELEEMNTSSEQADMPERFDFIKFRTQAEFQSSKDEREINLELQTTLRIMRATSADTIKLQVENGHKLISQRRNQPNIKVNTLQRKISFRPPNEIPLENGDDWIPLPHTRQSIPKQLTSEDSISASQISIARQSQPTKKSKSVFPIGKLFKRLYSNMKSQYNSNSTLAPTVK